jgi:cytochrome c-type biogenesis protein CcmE
MRRLGSRKLKVLSAAVVVVVAVGVLLWLGLGRGAVYYYSVSEFNSLANAQNVRVSGELVAGTLLREGASGTHFTFQIHDRDLPATNLNVTYDGALPGTFEDRADTEVVVQGDRLPDGTFLAHTFIAKCPSKYEATP